MIDSDISVAIIDAIQSGLFELGVDAIVQRDYQVTQQGAPSSPFIAFHSIATVRRGHPKNKSKYDAINNRIVQTEGTIIERTYQISAYAPESPEDDYEINAYDLASYAAKILQKETVLANLKQLGISVMRVGEVREAYFTNDKERNETNSNFDFVICYDDMITTTANMLRSIEPSIKRV